MTNEEHVTSCGPISPGGIESSPPGLLREPLEFLFAEHYRHRQMCRVLEHLAAAPLFDATLIATTDDFIRNDLTLHVLDEEEDLFPLLRRRCEAEDEIDDVLDRLSVDHAADQDQARIVRTYLVAALEKKVAPSTFPGCADAFQRLARLEKNHVALENAVVMPMARRRLLASDLEALSRSLAARRSVTL